MVLLRTKNICLNKWISKYSKLYTQTVCFISKPMLIMEISVERTFSVNEIKKKNSNEDLNFCFGIA